jgi:hypothetical protein
MPKLTIKTEYADKLKALGVYDLWLEKCQIAMGYHRLSFESIERIL